MTDDQGGQTKAKAKDDTATTKTTRHDAGDDKGGASNAVEPGDDKGKGGDDD